MGMKRVFVMMAAVVLVGCGGSKEKATPETQAKAETKKPEAVPVVTVTIDNPILENTIREYLDKPAAELTNADLEKVGELNFNNRGLTDAPKGLEKLTQLRSLRLSENPLTDVTGLEKFTQLTSLSLFNNPALTKAQIDELQKALPKCIISSNPTK